MLNRRVDLHAIDATRSMGVGDAGSSARRSQHGIHPTHWLISTQVAMFCFVVGDVGTSLALAYLPRLSETAKGEGP